MKKLALMLVAIAAATVFGLAQVNKASADQGSFACLDAQIDQIGKIIDVDNTLIFQVDRDTQPDLWQKYVNKRIAIANATPKECK